MAEEDSVDLEGAHVEHPLTSIHVMNGAPTGIRPPPPIVGGQKNGLKAQYMGGSPQGMVHSPTTIGELVSEMQN